MRFLRDIQDVLEFSSEEDPTILARLQLKTSERKIRECIEDLKEEALEQLTEKLENCRVFIDAEPERIAKATSTLQKINSYAPHLLASLEVTEAAEFNELQKIAGQERLLTIEKTKRDQTTKAMFAFFDSRRKNLEEIRHREQEGWDISDKSLVRNPSLEDFVDVPSPQRSPRR